MKAYALAAKNIKNSTLFIIKNLQSAYKYAPNEAYQGRGKNKVNADNPSEKEEIPKGFYQHLKKVDMSRGQEPHHNSRPKQAALSGKRNGTVYTTHFSRQKDESNPPYKVKVKVHADVHGSLNIGRKFLPRLNFSYLGHNMAIFKFKVKKLAKRGKLGLMDLKD